MQMAFFTLRLRLGPCEGRCGAQAGFLAWAPCLACAQAVKMDGLKIGIVSKVQGVRVGWLGRGQRSGQSSSPELSQFPAYLGEVETTFQQLLGRVSAGGAALGLSCCLRWGPAEGPETSAPPPVSSPPSGPAAAPVPTPTPTPPGPEAAGGRRLEG